MRVNRGLAEMLKGGVIMDVVNPEQAKIAEDAGATAVMALERVPADIRRDGGVARMSDPEMIEGIKAVVTIPVMAKARIGHFVEAQILEALGVDFIDESEVLTPADETHHIDKFAFTSPFVCGATNLGEALRRISEGAALIRSKGEAGTGARNCRDGQTASANLLCWRNSNACRRCISDATWRRSRIRWIWNFQERRSIAASESDCSGNCAFP
jgi:pyridoxal 5'-phosphate synthase subunit Pdx1